MESPLEGVVRARGRLVGVAVLSASLLEQALVDEGVDWAALDVEQLPKRPEDGAPLPEDHQVLQHACPCGACAISQPETELPECQATGWGCRVYNDLAFSTLYEVRVDAGGFEKGVAQTCWHALDLRTIHILALAGPVFVRE